MSSDVPPSDAVARTSPGIRWPEAFAALSAAVMATFDVFNTSIGWHLASGRWMLEHGRVLRTDPFTFTAAGVPWVDHEWLFQIVVAALHSIGGAPALVGFRIAVAVAIAVLLVRIGRHAGLAPGAALLLATVSVWGARPRLFVRPELVTLVLAVLAVDLFLDRSRSLRSRTLAIAIVTAVGANFHAGILIVPPILASLWLAETVSSLRTGRPWLGAAVRYLAPVLAAAAAPMLNPHGWRLYAVPIEISHLVGLPHIPNPEWLSPSPADAPALWAAIVASVVTLAITRERDPVRWMLLVVVTALALRHIRNVGLFFVLLPAAVAPALARVPLLGRAPAGRRLPVWTGTAAATLIAVSAAASPWPPFGMSWASNWYPDRACDALERLGLADRRLYNDVRFGGYLIQRRFPPHRVFLDDRNEIHEPLLRDIWDILQSSDVARWEALLAGWGLDTAMVRYHPPVTVRTPAGEILGERGFSALWFRPERWALVWFDDTAMVLVRRDRVDAELLARFEYRTFRPDDLQHLARQLAADRGRLDAVASEVGRALEDDPRGERVQALAALVTRVATSGQ